MHHGCDQHLHRDRHDLRALRQRGHQRAHRARRRGRRAGRSRHGCGHRDQRRPARPTRPSAPRSTRPVTSWPMPDTETLEPAPVTAAAKPSERASFRLAAFGAVLVVVLFAGYGIGRLNDSGTASSRRPGRARCGRGRGGPGDGHGGSPADGIRQRAATGDGHGHDADAQGGAAAPHDDTGTAPHVHNADGSVTPAAGGGTTAGAVGRRALRSAASGLTLVAGGDHLRRRARRRRSASRSPERVGRRSRRTRWCTTSRCT